MSARLFCIVYSITCLAIWLVLYSYSKDVYAVHCSIGDFIHFNIANKDDY